MTHQSAFLTEDFIALRARQDRQLAVVVDAHFPGDLPGEIELGDIDVADALANEFALRQVAECLLANHGAWLEAQERLHHLRRTAKILTSLPAMGGVEGAAFSHSLPNVIEQLSSDVAIPKLERGAAREVRDAVSLLRAADAYRSRVEGT